MSDHKGGNNETYMHSRHASGPRSLRHALACCSSTGPRGPNGRSFPSQQNSGTCGASWASVGSSCRLSRSKQPTLIIWQSVLGRTRFVRARAEVRANRTAIASSGGTFSKRSADDFAADCCQRTTVGRHAGAPKCTEPHGAATCSGSGRNSFDRQRAGSWIGSTSRESWSSCPDNGLANRRLRSAGRIGVLYGRWLCWSRLC